MGGKGRNHRDRQSRTEGEIRRKRKGQKGHM